MLYSGCLAADSISGIVNEIRMLENERDPKCYATASRLEDFMFGTPLNHNTRFIKNQLQKQWVKDVWYDSSQLASRNGKQQITSSELETVVSQYFSTAQQSNQHWQLGFSNNNIVNINSNDKRQYSTIAYSLRAILAVQQESLLELEFEFLPFSQNSLKDLANSLDLLNLSVLKLSDLSARKNNRTEVSVETFQNIWNELLNKNTSVKRPIDVKVETKTVAQNGNNKLTDLSLIHNIIDQKISSYKAYNKISTQLFNRNLQVYFARMNWPEDKEKQKAFRKVFTESMIQFAFDVYKESEKIARKNGHSMILEQDVHQLIQLFIPHNIDEFEDATFFPKLSKEQQIAIESYDADSFRDNSAHWRFLKYALNSSNLNAKLQPDPFALELMAENIALFGVLSLKMAGIQGKSSDAPYLQDVHYQQGLVEIAERVSANGRIEHQPVSLNELISTHSNTQNIKELKDFSDITSELGINITHRSSDWLSRLLRSFLEKSKDVGVVFIPPAFGGSGIAAEDINNDGYVDLLILSGRGNKLYMNKMGKSFVDVTKDSGIEWFRPDDHLPGEPRQPLIADINNDGLQDIVITYVNDQHRVYQNEGNFRFTDVTDIANLGGSVLVGGPATIADFDNDGLLDIYITYFGHYTKGILPSIKRQNDNGLPNQLFKNMGDFRFKNVTQGSGVDNTGWTQAVSHTDFNGDGWQDIIVGNDFGSNAYYQNNRDGTFIDVARQLGTDKASYSMNVGIADLNQDLIPDIYISNIVVMNKDEKYVLPNENTTMKFDSDKLANMRVIEANDLFLSNQSESGEMFYALSQSVGRGYSSTGWSWDADFFDYDNDGDEDLYVLNGMNEFNIYTGNNPYFKDSSNRRRNIYIPVSTKESNVFFVNDKGKLNNRSKNSGIDLLGNSRSAAYLDFDRDGDLDIALNNFHESAVFYQNNLANENNNWISLRLVGDIKKKVNRDAIGAKIVIRLKNKTTIWREIHGSIGYMSVHPKLQHFGLGDSAIDHIQILWPNGESQQIDSLKSNREFTIFQSKNEPKIKQNIQ